MLRRRAKQTRDLPVLRRHEDDAPRMSGGIRDARAMAGAATPQIDDSPVLPLGIHRLRDSGGPADRQNHPEGDQRQIAVEQERAVDLGACPDSCWRELVDEG